MHSVSTIFKEQQDFLYQRGEKKAKEKMSHKLVENLILKLSFTDEQVADFAEVDMEYVKKVRIELSNK